MRQSNVVMIIELVWSPFHFYMVFGNFLMERFGEGRVWPHILSARWYQKESSRRTGLGTIVYLWIYLMLCWSQSWLWVSLIDYGSMLLAVCNCLFWTCLHHGNWQSLQIRASSQSLPHIPAVKLTSIPLNMLQVPRAVLSYSWCPINTFWRNEWMNTVWKPVKVSLWKPWKNVILIKINYILEVPNIRILFWKF